MKVVPVLSRPDTRDFGASDPTFVRKYHYNNREMRENRTDFLHLRLLRRNYNCIIKDL